MMDDDKKTKEQNTRLYEKYKSKPSETTVTKHYI